MAGAERSVGLARPGAKRRERSAPVKKTVPGRAGAACSHGDGCRPHDARIDETRSERVELGPLNGYTASGTNPPLVGAVRSEIAKSRLTSTVWNHSETGSLQNMYSRTASVMATMVGR